jgi:hypothetical protein
MPCLIFHEERRIRTPVGTKPTDLESVPFDRSGISSHGYNLDKKSVFKFIPIEEIRG